MNAYEYLRRLLDKGYTVNLRSGLRYTDGDHRVEATLGAVHDPVQVTVSGQGPTLGEAIANVQAKMEEFKLPT